MRPISPFWFRQRQAEIEPAGENLYRVTAPNLLETFLAIRQGEDRRWSAELRQAADGSAVAVSEATYDHPRDAWSAAFELYRNDLVV